MRATSDCHWASGPCSKSTWGRHSVPRKDLKNGESAYRRLNEQAMRLLSNDGILISASRSMHLPEDDLQNILLTSARHLDRTICWSAAARARTIRCI